MALARAWELLGPGAWLESGTGESPSGGRKTVEPVGASGRESPIGHESPGVVCVCGRGRTLTLCAQRCHRGPCPGWRAGHAAGHCHCLACPHGTWNLLPSRPLIFSRETHQVFTCVLRTGFWGEFSVQAPQPWVWTPKASTFQVTQPLSRLSGPWAAPWPHELCSLGPG